MPTGYTSELLKNQNFKDFILTCAKAFGVSLSLEKDSSGKPIAEPIQIDDYYYNKIEETKHKLQKLLKMGKSHLLELAEKQISSDKISAIKYLESIENENKIFQDMLDQVEEWQPPTKEHEKLKEFMIRQLNMSMNEVKYAKDRIIFLNNLDIEKYIADMIESLEKDIIYYKKKHKEEFDSVQEKNLSNKELIDSL